MSYSKMESFYSIVIPAPVDVVWNEFTTENGIRSFMAPRCHIIAQPNGPFEISFNDPDEDYKHGNSGGFFLSIMPYQFLSLSWSFPSKFSSLKNQKVLLCIIFEEQDEKTCVSVFLDNNQSKGDWEYGCEFIKNQWRNIFLPQLLIRFSQGPINWSPMQ